MAESDKEKNNNLSRRDFLRYGFRAIIGLGALSVAWHTLFSSKSHDMVWQLDPDKCIQCGRCATRCVLSPSAVKCVHAFAICGYCDLCSGYFRQPPFALDTAAENRLCPTSAIKRTYVEDPYYEYTIDQSLCIGCGKCVKGCGSFGNGSLFLQVMHDRCVNCNECSIAVTCPAKAYTRVPAHSPYLLKKAAEGSG